MATRAARPLGRVLEAIAAVDRDADEWTYGVAAAVGSLVGAVGFGVAPFRWGASEGKATLTSDLITNIPGLPSEFGRFFGAFTPDEHRGIFCDSPVKTLYDLPANNSAGPRKIASAVSSRDWVLVTSLDTDGSGLQFGFPLAQRAPVGATERRVLEHLTAHITAAGRVRRVQGTPEAVFTPGGRVEHAEPTAQSFLPALREIVLRANLARGSSASASEALAGWSAVIRGRFTLVDQFESDGRHYVVARENEPRAALPASIASVPLTALESNALVLLARGYALKGMAYELGVHPGTLVRTLTSARRKLGLRTRGELTRAARLALGRDREEQIG